MDKKCIYCLALKAKSRFNVEHLLHSSMTKGFKNNLTLIDLVCSDCNQFFGDSIDQTFGRSGPQGLLRFDHGMKPLKQLREFDGRSTSQKIQSLDPYYDGATVINVIRGDRREYDYLPQVQFERKDGTYLRLTINQLSNLENVLADTSLTGVVGFLGDAEEIQKVFSAAIQKLGRAWEPVKYIAPGEHPVFFQHNLSDHEARAISKVAFNYLVFVTQSQAPELAFQKCFDPIRTFIKSGLITDLQPKIGFVQAAAIPYLGSTALSSCHLVAMDAIQLSKDQNYVACIVNLFQQVTFIVYLSWNFGVSWKFASAHCWNLNSRKISHIDRPELKDFIKYASTRASIHQSGASPDFSLDFS